MAPAWPAPPGRPLRDLRHAFPAKREHTRITITSLLLLLVLVGPLSGAPGRVWSGPACALNSRVEFRDGPTARVCGDAQHLPGASGCRVRPPPPPPPLGQRAWGGVQRSARRVGTGPEAPTHTQAGELDKHACTRASDMYIWAHAHMSSHRYHHHHTQPHPSRPRPSRRHHPASRLLQVHRGILGQPRDFLHPPAHPGRVNTAGR